MMSDFTEHFFLNEEIRIFPCKKYRKWKTCPINFKRTELMAAMPLQNLKSLLSLT